MSKYEVGNWINTPFGPYKVIENFGYGSTLISLDGMPIDEYHPIYSKEDIKIIRTHLTSILSDLETCLDYIHYKKLLRASMLVSSAIRDAKRSTNAEFI